MKIRGKDSQKIIDWGSLEGGNKTSIYFKQRLLYSLSSPRSVACLSRPPAQRFIAMQSDKQGTTIWGWFQWRGAAPAPPKEEWKPWRWEWNRLQDSQWRLSGMNEVERSKLPANFLPIFFGDYATVLVGWLFGPPAAMSIYGAFNTSTPIFCSSRPQQDGQSRGHGKRLVSMMMRSHTCHDLHNNNSVDTPPLSVYLPVCLISSSRPPSLWITTNIQSGSAWWVICTWDEMIRRGAGDTYEWVGGGCRDLFYSLRMVECRESRTMCVFIETTKTENDSSPLESIRN